MDYRGRTLFAPTVYRWSVRVGGRRGALREIISRNWKVVTFVTRGGGILVPVKDGRGALI